MKKVLTCFLLLITCLSCILTSFAHQGKTDGNGGHRDNNNKSGLGYYHYHCGGYPAHLHNNGVCPYTSSGYSSSSYDDYDEGYGEGHSDGYYDGYDDGLEEGYNQGYSKGCRDGYDEGYYEVYDKYLEQDEELKKLQTEKENNTTTIITLILISLFLGYKAFSKK